MWKMLFLITYLMILTLFDLKEKRVPVVWLALGLLVAGGRSVYLNCIEQQNWLQMLLGMMPGALLLLVSFTTKKVGFADGIVLGIIGMFENYKVSLFVLCMGLFWASVVSVVLLVLRKVKRNIAIPFIPFLTAAFCMKEVLQ